MMLDGSSNPDVAQGKVDPTVGGESSNTPETQSPDKKATNSAASEADSPDGLETAAVLRVVGSTAGQTTLIAALLFYFGWARTQAAFSYFGIDSSIAQLSVSDYILRSIDVTVRPLVILGLLILIVLYGHRWLASKLAARGDPKLGRIVMLVCIIVGGLFCVLGVLGFYNVVVYSSKYPFVPVLLAIGVTFVGYGFSILGIARPDLPRRRWRFRSQAIIVVILDIALLFWAVSVYASVSGQQAAAKLASSLGAQPGVVIYSESSLSLNAPGVEVSQLRGPGNQYHYRYSNLRFLLYSNGEYFLLPDGWKQGKDPVFLLKVNDSLRLEFYSGLQRADACGLSRSETHLFDPDRTHSSAASRAASRG
jgi:hypothetical protein